MILTIAPSSFIYPPVPPASLLQLCPGHHLYSLSRSSFVSWSVYTFVFESVNDEIFFLFFPFFLFSFFVFFTFFLVFLVFFFYLCPSFMCRRLYCMSSFLCRLHLCRHLYSLCPGRNQFPIWLVFAITINKAQGQSLESWGISKKTKKR